MLESAMSALEISYVFTCSTRHSSNLIPHSKPTLDYPRSVSRNLTDFTSTLPLHVPLRYRFGMPKTDCQFFGPSLCPRQKHLNRYWMHRGKNKQKKKTHLPLTYQILLRSGYFISILHFTHCFHR